jgi:hypothetical protein
MKLTPSKLRQDIYRLLDKVAKTGIPIEIDRKGIRLQIIRAKKKSKLDNLKKRKTLNCDPEDIVHMDWSSEWKWTG